MPKGLGAAGKHLASSLAKLMPSAVSYAVDYPVLPPLPSPSPSPPPNTPTNLTPPQASFDLTGGGCRGVKDMIRRIEERAKACPGIKFALGGHSQGGAVCTAAIPQIPKSYLPSIVAVTMFGSPPCRDVPQVAGRCKSFCNKGDNVGGKKDV